MGLGEARHTTLHDYRGYGLDPSEAQARLLEAEEIMQKAWTTNNRSTKASSGTCGSRTEAAALHSPAPVSDSRLLRRIFDGGDGAAGSSVR